ncbi:MAG: amylo-alpha-1,6-glucosidase [bacterium]
MDQTIIKNRRIRLFAVVLLLLNAFATESLLRSQEKNSTALATEILADTTLPAALTLAKETLRSGFVAGSGYDEVWIRDLNTFILLSLQLLDPERVEHQLRMFLRFQSDEGEIVDGFVPDSLSSVPYQYIRNRSISRYAAHKNTVATDQEASLVQAVWKYVHATGNRAFLETRVDSIRVIDRLEKALFFLLGYRYSMMYGLLWGATTVDWGDVQPEHPWGVELDGDTHYAVDVYDNAMMLIAIQNFLMLSPENPRRSFWEGWHDRIKRNVRTKLWDGTKFIPHLYIDGSPFPSTFNERELYYHGGTAVAIEAGLLTREEIQRSLAIMRSNVRQAGASSIGLTLHPVYPMGFFKNSALVPYSYQNGGDWPWFGGRMVQALITHGFVEDAYFELKPMVAHALRNRGYYEWYTLKGEPKGSGTFRGAAGVVGKAIQMLLEWAQAEQEGKK